MRTPDPGDLVAATRPRNGVVAEVEVGSGDDRVWCFEQAEGPLASYRRTVTAAADGTFTQTVALEVGLAPVGWIFGPPLRRLLGRLGPEARLPWWLPPARLTRPAAQVLVAACCLDVLVGYLGDLLAYTMTYAGSEFGAGSTAQGLALGLGQLSAVVALPVLALADRRGRRSVLLAALVGAAVLTAAGAATGSLATLTGTQVLAGAADGAAAVLVGILVVEAVPAGARAWSLGVATMCVGLGSGLAVAAIPLAGEGDGGWRWLYVLGAAGAPLAVVAWRRLPPPGRPAAAGAEPAPGPAVAAAAASPVAAAPAHWDSRAWRALGLLGAGGFLLALFADPGGSLQAQYLRHQRHLSPLSISILLQVTGTVGGLGTLVGGRLADTRGRRPVAAVGVVALAATTVAVYRSGGLALWVWESLSSAVSYGIGPALGVYGAELFASRLRGRAGGVITVASAAGGICGLALAGVVSGRTGTVAPALEILAAGPLAVAALVVWAYPETAGVDLVELHPGDRDPLIGQKP